ncbi:hypothetical protein CDAR_172351 [Caerostris darwini]|uniref:Uncharacterized protein n=1 Tax=Caerostris darwini TaxID=1538125 RepID=A0AAV4MFW9_9ARAC|nr:hypothetical protein CDAR_172351 [Caerostris darwini]
MFFTNDSPITSLINDGLPYSLMDCAVVIFFQILNCGPEVRRHVSTLLHHEFNVLESSIVRLSRVVYCGIVLLFWSQPFVGSLLARRRVLLRRVTATSRMFVILLEDAVLKWADGGSCTSQPNNCSTWISNLPKGLAESSLGSLAEFELFIRVKTIWTLDNPVKWLIRFGRGPERTELINAYTITISRPSKWINNIPGLDDRVF